MPLAARLNAAPRCAKIQCRLDTAHEGAVRVCCFTTAKTRWARGWAGTQYFRASKTMPFIRTPRMVRVAGYQCNCSVATPMTAASCPRRDSKEG
jgi:hypothetical protein